jgi:hypothetical protein
MSYEETVVVPVFVCRRRYCQLPTNDHEQYAAQAGQRRFRSEHIQERFLWLVIQAAERMAQKCGGSGPTPLGCVLSVHR